VVQNAYDRGVAFLQHGLRCCISATGVAFGQHPFDLQIFGLCHLLRSAQH